MTGCVAGRPPVARDDDRWPPQTVCPSGVHPLDLPVDVALAGTEQAEGEDAA